MNKNLTLLIMAAGMGSRFGGLKQIEPVGPNDEFLIDYSVYDAIKAGFNKVVFVIKKENYELFKETIGKRVEDKIKTEYAFQDMNNLPDGYTKPLEREKPWGTAHAILCAKDLINEPFAIINADDFYGRDAYYVVSRFLKNNVKDNNYCLIGYKVQNTLTENGSVKRGICKLDRGMLVELIESNVEIKDGHILATPLDGRNPFIVSDDTYVSMNMLGFTKEIFKNIEDNFPKFLDEHINDLKSEYLIPDVLEKLTLEGKIITNVIPTSSKWMGITYKEDKEEVVKSLKLSIDNGDYPNRLWN